MSLSYVFLIIYLFLNYNAKVMQNFNTDKSLLKKNQFINIY